MVSTHSVVCGRWLVTHGVVCGRWLVTHGVVCGRWLVTHEIVVLQELFNGQVTKEMRASSWGVRQVVKIKELWGGGAEAIEYSHYETINKCHITDTIII